MDFGKQRSSAGITQRAPSRGRLKPPPWGPKSAGSFGPGRLLEHGGSCRAAVWDTVSAGNQTISDRKYTMQKIVEVGTPVPRPPPPTDPGVRLFRSPRDCSLRTSPLSAIPRSEVCMCCPVSVCASPLSLRMFAPARKNRGRGLRDSCGGATVDTGGWSSRTRPGLSPGKKYQALFGARTAGRQAGAQRRRFLRFFGLRGGV